MAAPGDEHPALDSVVAAPELPRKRARSAENVWSMGSVVMGSAYTAHMECGVGATRRSRLKVLGAGPPFDCVAIQGCMRIHSARVLRAAR